MKKIFLFLAAAALMAVACNKSETVVRDINPGEIGFHAFSGNITKGAELSGVIMPQTYGIYAAATQKNAGGLIENASFFGNIEQLFATADAEPTAASLWRATPPIYWPIGGVKLDFLAYAMKQTSHVSGLPGPGTWMASWDNATTDVASELAFKEVDTYAHQEDVLYAVANGQSSAVNGGMNGETPRSVNLSFDHAQSLLIFNVKANVEDKLSIEEISFVTPQRVEALRTYQIMYAASNYAKWEQKKIADGYEDMDTDGKTAWDTENPEPNDKPVLDDLAEADVTLKTIGTFTVNNQRNILAADWTFGEHPTSADNYCMPNFSEDAVRSEANSATGSGAIKYGASIVNTEDYTQLGETLLIPQQDKVNFTIKYKFGNQIMYYTFNDARGVWMKGKKYLYNLDLSLNEVVITEQVSDYVGVPSGNITL